MLPLVIVLSGFPLLQFLVQTSHRHPLLRALLIHLKLVLTTHVSDLSFAGNKHLLVPLQKRLLICHLCNNASVRICRCSRHGSDQSVVQAGFSAIVVESSNVHIHLHQRQSNFFYGKPFVPCRRGPLSRRFCLQTRGEQSQE